MESASWAIFDNWSPPILLTGILVVFALIYLRGWFQIRRTRSSRFSAWRLISFLLGSGVIWLAIASPLDGFADVLLSAHMVEHLLLMSFAPPLLLMGWPVVPVLRGLPRVFIRSIVGPLIRRRGLRRFVQWLVNPIVAWLAMNLTFLVWHVPTAYDFALEHEHWHELEHLCFLVTSVLFWWPLIRPWPTRTKEIGWFMLPYLVLADIVNTALSGFLAFCERPIYGYYLRESDLLNIAPAVDQRAGAVIMWVVGSIVYLIPAVFITYRLVQHQEAGRPKAMRRSDPNPLRDAQPTMPVVKTSQDAR